MTDEPEKQTNLADDCKKLLDSGWTIVLFRNQLGSYTAQCRKKGVRETEAHITDDFEPSAALYRLTEKVTTGRIVGVEK